MACRNLFVPRTVCHSADAHAPIVALHGAEAVLSTLLGEIDVQAHPFRQTFFQHIISHLSDVGSQRLEVSILIVVAQREGYGGNVLHAAFHHHPHRTTVMAVHRGIITVIDAAHHQVGPAPTQQLAQCQFHTVNRCSVGRPYLHALLLVLFDEPQGHGGREGARKA